MAILVPPDWTSECPLKGYEIPCGGSPQIGHIISRGKASGSKAQSQLDDEINLAWMCRDHNVGRWADQYQALRILFKLQIRRHGREEVRDWLNGLKWKVPYYKMSFEGLALDDDL